MYMKMRQLHKKQYGFTIVELMVVIVVIGLLIAATAFAWSGWRDRAARAELKNDLTNLASAMDSRRNWSDGYPVFAPGTVFGNDSATRKVMIPSTNVTLTYRSGDTKNYCVDAVSSTRPSVQFFLRVDSSVNEKKPQPGHCS